MKVTPKNVYILASLIAGACVTSIEAAKLRFVKAGTMDRQMKEVNHKTPTSPPKRLGVFAVDQVRLIECRNVWRIL